LKKLLETFYKLNIKNSVLNSIIAILSLLVLYLLYTFISHNFLRPPVSAADGNKVIQVDVLNGCGATGVAVKFTEFLRARGFDVLEMGNYKSFDVEESIVLDRIGNIDIAKKVANAIGINEKNIVQQLSNDSYIDCTIVIGRDFKNLKPMK
jgi:hypothetical protein